MPTFAYDAIDHRGTRTKGEVVASDQIAALDVIAAKGLTPLDVTEGGSVEPWWNRDIALLSGSQLKASELEKLFSGLAAMLTAQTPLPRALRFCIDLTNDKMMKAKLRSALLGVEDGKSLADALAADSVPFPERLIAMIHLGETSNKLGIVVDRAAKMLESEAKLRREIQQALIYPIILLCMSVFVLSVLVFYLAPTLAPVFASADTDPPAIIAAMLWIQRMLTTDWPVILVGLLVCIVVLYALRSSIALAVQWVLNWLPITRGYLSKRETLQFCQTLYLMLRSGGQLTDAIKTAAGTTSQRKWQAMLLQAHKDIEAGQTMSQALLGNPLIDQMARTILTTGEESDQLEAVLEPAVSSLQAQTSQTLSQAVKLLTPLLTLMIGLAVGAIILSTISAIMDLNDVVL